MKIDEAQGHIITSEVLTTQRVATDVSLSSFDTSNQLWVPPILNVPPNLVHQGTSLTPGSSEIGSRSMPFYPHAATWD